MAQQSNQNQTGEQKKSPVTVTPKAVEELKRLLEKEEDPNTFVRIGIQSGGCSGMSYAMAFDTNVTEHDHVFDFDGLPVRIDSRALVYLGGAVVDYNGGLLGGGFEFSNPNAKRSCGCGTSFSV